MVITMPRPRVPQNRATRATRCAVIFPGETLDRSLSAPQSWLSDPLIAEASACAGTDIGRALSGRSVLGPAIVQPAIVALELIAWRRLRARGLVPMLVAGQGVGEIAAWAAGGAIEDHDAHKLAALRGAAIHLASLVHPSARRGVPGGWNAIAMAPAQDALNTAVAQVRRFHREIAQVGSTTGAVLAEDDAPDLAAQLVEPASWRRVIDTFLRFAITDVIVLPPSRMLKNLLRDSFGSSVVVHSAEDDADLDALADLAPITQRPSRAAG